MGALALATVCLATQVQAEDRLAHINFRELLLIMPGYDELKESLGQYDAELANKLKAMQDEFERKSKEFADQQGSMANSVRQLRLGEIRALEVRAQEFGTTAQESIRLKESELLQPVISKAQEIIKEVAKENQFTYVIDTAQGIVLYFDEARDLMPLVKKKLGSR